MNKKTKVVNELPLIEVKNLEKPIGKVAEECYTIYGSYVNNFRAIPNIVDGLKVSYKRLIWAAMQFPKGQSIPTMNLVSSLSRYHPHSVQSCEDLNANLVKSGVFSGEGFFGNVQIDGIVNPHAATRYTHNRLSDLYWGIWGDIIKDVPKVESPQGELEPINIPSIFPLCLYLKNLVQGLGVGVSTIFPNFSPKSLYAAYINNNPQLLEPNVDLILDKKNSELERLWKTGKGRVIYSYKISRHTNGKEEGILFETKDGTEIFTPKLSKFRKLAEEGKVVIEDVTDKDGAKLFVYRIPGAKGITVDDIESLARKCCYDATIYQLNVTDGNTCFRIPLYDWLDYTYKNYINLLVEVNKKKIIKCEFDILVQEAIPIIADYILNKNPKATDTEIAKVFGFSQEIIDVVMQKPISYLRKNKDTSDRIKELKEKLKQLKSFDPIKYAEELVNKL